MRWKREYEETVRALTLREEVADGWKTSVHRSWLARRIEDGLLGWNVSSIFDGHTIPAYGNHILEDSTDRETGS